MADIELVIKIPEEIIENIKNSGCLSVIYNDEVAKAIISGILLPKGHGRLKDVDKIISDGRSKGFCDWYDEMKYADTIIEADKEVDKK